MSATTNTPATQASPTEADVDATLTPSPPPRRQRRRRVFVSATATVCVAVIGAGVFAVVQPFDGNSDATNGDAKAAAGASVATVTTQTLTARTSVTGTLEHAGAAHLVNHANGLVTWLPRVGDVVDQGGVLYRVAGAPVILLYGANPAYRDLAYGGEGPDVEQLKRALVALGYASEGALDSTPDRFTAETRAAVKKLQDALGVDETGALALGSVAFMPSAVRVTSVGATLGASVQPDATVLDVTSTTRIVTVDLDTDQQSQVKVGDTVEITMPDNTTTQGVVWSVGTVATAPAEGDSSTSPTIPVEIALNDPNVGSGLDQAPVLVSITTATVEDALVVPVTALLALASGGYAVEVVDADGTHHLVRVETGLFDDAVGLVQVTGSDLSDGQHVLVPSS